MFFRTLLACKNKFLFTYMLANIFLSVIFFFLSCNIFACVVNICCYFSQQVLDYFYFAAYFHYQYFIYLIMCERVINLFGKFFSIYKKYF